MIVPRPVLILLALITFVPLLGLPWARDLFCFPP